MATLNPRHRSSCARSDGRRRSISDDPLIDRLHHGLPELFLLAYLCFLAYCSLLPFGASPRLHVLLPYLDFQHMTIKSAGMKDILPNIFLFIPLGAGSYVVARRAEWGRIAAVITGLVLCTGTSLLLELLQQWRPLRVSSWVDVVSNMAGGLVGTVLGRSCRRLLERILSRGRFEVRHMPISTATRAYALLLILTGIIPLDFTFDTSRLARAAAKANVVPFTPPGAWEVRAGQAEFAADLPEQVALRRIKVDFWLDMVAEAVAFGLFGILLAMSFRREHQTGMIQGWMSAVIYAAFLAFGLSGLQFFILSRGFDSNAIVVRTVSATLSALATVWVIRGSPGSGFDVRLPGLPAVGHRVAGLLTAGAVVYILCRGLSPFLIMQHGPMTHGIWQTVGLVPFEGYFHSRFFSSAEDILYKVLRYATFGVLAALAAGLPCRGSFHRRAWRIAACGALISTMIELCQIVLPTRWPDLTHVLLAAFGSYSGAIAARWVNDYYHAVRDRWLARFESAFETAAHAVPAVGGLNVEIPPPDESAPKEAPADPMPSPPAQYQGGSSDSNVAIPPREESAPKPGPQEQTPAQPTEHESEG